MLAQHMTNKGPMPAGLTPQQQQQQQQVSLLTRGKARSPFSNHL
jgi:hypothetical protein